MTNFNTFIGSVNKPIHPYLPDRLFLTLNKEGHIERCWNSSTVHFHSFAQFLSAQRSVFDVFDLGTVKNLEDAARIGERNFPVKTTVPKEYFLFEPFSTKIPLCSLRLFRISANQYCGMVVATHFLPNIYYANENIVLYTDAEDRLLGYNGTVRRLFHDRLAGPDDLLGKPAAEILNPAPGQIQERYLDSVRNLEWPSLKDEVVLSGHALPGSGTWSNAGEKPLHFHLPVTLDTIKSDFRFTAEVRIAGNAMPLLVFGPGPDQAYEPAAQGYQVSESVFKTSACYQIKRNGFAVRTAVKDRVAGEWLELSIEKRGRALFFRVNGREKIAYYDPCFLHNTATSFYLGLRPEGEVRIRSLRLQSADTVPGGTLSDEVIVAARTTTPRYYSLNAFHNVQLSSAYPFFHGYILHDVTGFSEKVRQYQDRLQSERLKGARLRRRLQESGAKNEFFIGESRAIHVIKEQAAAMAGSGAPILITGETGTGKEVLARFLHDRSARKEKPFVKLDCSALPGSLIESELFGHEKGAFTGAVDRKTGRFEQAHGGTLFLDEIANLHLDVQAKLLNVLQDMTITRIGGLGQIRLDVRLITATNIPIASLLALGRFREDLFYRINTLTLDLPPLRKRMDDLPLLVRQFVSQFSGEQDKSVRDVSEAAWRKLNSHSWPGNIRELRNVIQRAVIFCEGEVIGENVIQIAFEPSAPGPSGVKERKRLSGLTCETLKEKLAACAGSVTRLARELGVSRRACYNHLEKHGLRSVDFRLLKEK